MIYVLCSLDGMNLYVGGVMIYIGVDRISFCVTSYSYNLWIHRLNGPALIGPNYEYFYIDDIRYTEDKFHEVIKEMGL